MKRGTGTSAIDTLAQLCVSASEKYKERPAFAMLSEGRICRRVTYSQMGQRACQMGSLFNQLGAGNKDGSAGKVLLLSENSPEWAVAYFGIAAAGAVSVPLLTGFSAEQIQNIAEHAEVTAVCISRAMAEKFDQIKKTRGFSALPFIYIDSMTIEENLNMHITVSVNGGEKTIIIPACGALPLSANSEDIKPNDPASLVYTSGTQGSSKGVMLSNLNLISSALSSISYGKMYPRDRLLSVLPLAHSYECTLGLIAPVMSGACITYLDKPPSPSVLLPALKLLRPTIMISVPLLIEKVYNNAIAPKLNASALYKFRLTRIFAVRIAGLKLLSALGGKIRFFGIGGAPLSAEVEKFLYSARFPYTVGYGLTEASPLVAGNTPLRFKLNKGFIPPKGVRIRITKCPESTAEGIGEIQVNGKNVMLGYYKDKIKTDEVITSDGWLRTGDLGNIDNKGKLHIRGRIKALILGPSGENIYPEEIEGLLGTSTLIEDALVYSGEKGELVALVRLNETAKAVTGAVEHVLEELRSWVNKKLAAFSRLNRIDIKNEPFEKTPTMKIKRYLYVL